MNWHPQAICSTFLVASVLAVFEISHFSGRNMHLGTCTRTGKMSNTIFKLYENHPYNYEICKHHQHQHSCFVFWCVIFMRFGFLSPIPDCNSIQCSLQIAKTTQSQWFFFSLPLGGFYNNSCTKWKIDKNELHWKS